MRIGYLKKKKKQNNKEKADNKELNKKQFDSVLETMLKTPPKSKKKNK